MLNYLFTAIFIWMIADELVGRVRTGHWPTITRLRELPKLPAQIRETQEQIAKLNLLTAAIGAETEQRRTSLEREEDRFEGYKIVSDAIWQHVMAGTWRGDDSIAVELADETNQPLNVVFETLDMVREVLAENVPGPLLHRMFNSGTSDDT